MFRAEAAEAHRRWAEAETAAAAHQREVALRAQREQEAARKRQNEQNMSKWSPTPRFPERKSKQNHKTLHAWLLEHKLEEYHERLVAEGITELDDFKELQERDITRMMDKWNVGILPQRVFLNKVSGLMLPSYDSVPLSYDSAPPSYDSVPLSYASVPPSYDSVPPPLPAAKEEQPPAISSAQTVV